MIIISLLGGFFMEKKDIKIIKKRLKTFGIIVTLLFCSLGARLYYLQLYKHDEFKDMALKQRGKEISLFPKRGTIYDRNLVPLTNKETICTLILPKNLFLSNKELYEDVLNNTSMSYEEFYLALNSKDNLLQIPLNKKIDIENMPNVFQVDRTIRYNYDNLLSHVIGNINKAENKGESGLEKVYDEFLKNDDKNSLFVEYDKSRTMILGSSHYVNVDNEPNNPSGVKLTIDYNIQRIVENIMDNEKVNGAVIVGDVESKEILAMASRPNYDQNEVENYSGRDDMALYNKAVQVRYPPGSTFKIVVLLAALEENYDFLNRVYYCQGYEKLNNTIISCSKAHGYITLEEGFSHSCNSVFIQIGKELGGKKIISMAEKLGFGKKMNIGLVEEVEGNLPQGDELLGPAIGNISIGQGNIEVTPLQITNLLMTIINNGTKSHLSLVKGITNKEGDIIKVFNKEADEYIISIETSRILMNMLREVVTTGTAKDLNLDSIGGGGGKTGSAQAILNKKPTVHGWFTGFFPEYNPKYVITVLVEEGYSGSKSAAPIFEKIAKEINRIY